MSLLIQAGIYLAIAAAVAFGAHELWSKFTGQYIEEGMAQQHAIDEPIAAGYLERATTAEAEVNAQATYASSLEQKWRDAQDASVLEGQQVARLKDENAKLSREAAARLPADVAGQRIDGRAVCLLDGTCSTPIDAGAKGQAGSGGVAVGGTGPITANPKTPIDDASLAAVVDWGITCRTQYNAAREQVIGWVQYFNSLFP